MPAPRIPRTIARHKPKPGFRKRLKHLAFVRQLPCVACGKAAPSHATHVRTGTDGGVGIKPGDHYAVPLCADLPPEKWTPGYADFASARSGVM